MSEGLCVTSAGLCGLICGEVSFNSGCLQIRPFSLICLNTSSSVATMTAVKGLSLANSASSTPAVCRNENADRIIHIPLSDLFSIRGPLRIVCLYKALFHRGTRASEHNVIEDFGLAKFVRLIDQLIF